MIKQSYRRIYSDYLMPNRFGLYRHIEAALEKGYEHYTIYDFYKLMKSGNPTNKKYLFIAMILIPIRQDHENILKLKKQWA